MPGLLPAATITVNVTSFAFTPRTVTVQVGDTVHWVGVGSGHDVAQSNTPADTTYNGSGFYSGGPATGVSTFDVTFNSAGDNYYICEPHASAFNMKGLVVVTAPTPSPTPCVTPSATETESPSPSPTASPTPSPTISPTDSPTATPVPGSPTDSPTESPSFTVSPTPTASPSASPTPSLSPSFSASPTPTGSPSPSPTPSLSPSFSASPSPSATPSATPLLSPTPTATAAVLSFAGVEAAGLLASPITGGHLRLWASYTGAPQDAELRVYSSALTLLQHLDLGPQDPGTHHYDLPLDALAAQPVWLQLRVQEDGRWRKSAVLRSYVLP